MTIQRAGDYYPQHHILQFPPEIFSKIVEHLTTAEVLTLRICSKVLKSKIDEQTQWKDRSVCILRSFYLGQTFPNLFSGNQLISTFSCPLFKADVYKAQINDFLNVKVSSLREFEVRTLLENSALAGDLHLVQRSLSLLPNNAEIALCGLRACAQSDFPHILDWFISSSFFQIENDPLICEGLVASLKCVTDENFKKLYSLFKQERLLENRLYFPQLIFNAVSNRHFEAFSLLVSLDQGVEIESSALFEVARCSDIEFSIKFLEVFNIDQINVFILEEALQKAIKYGNIFMLRKIIPLLPQPRVDYIIQRNFPLAAENGCLNVIEELLYHVVNRSDKLLILSAALEKGCKKERRDIVRVLLSLDVIDSFDEKSLNKALITCVEKDNEALFEDVYSSKEKDYFSAQTLSKCLLSAVENESILMVNLILSKNPNIKLRECSLLNFNKEIYSILIRGNKIEDRALLDVGSCLIADGDLELTGEFISSFCRSIDKSFATKLLKVALDEENLGALTLLLSNETIHSLFEKTMWFSLFQKAITSEKINFAKELLNHIPADLEEEDLEKIVTTLLSTSSESIASDLSLYFAFFEIDPSKALAFLTRNLKTVSDEAFNALIESKLLLEDGEIFSEILEVLALDCSSKKIRAIFYSDLSICLKDSSIIRAHVHLNAAFKSGNSDALDGIEAIIRAESRRKLPLF